MRTRCRTAAAAFAACLALAGAGTATAGGAAAERATAAAACRHDGHKITVREHIPCRAAKGVLSGWLGFGAIDGALSGTAGGLAGQWNCWGATRKKAGRCKRTANGRGRVFASFRFR